MLAKRNRLLTVRCCSKKTSIISRPFHLSLPHIHTLCAVSFFFSQTSPFFSPFVVYVFSSTTSFVFISLAIKKVKTVKQLIPSIKEAHFLLSPNDSFLQRDPNSCNTWPLLHDSLAPEGWTYLENKPGWVCFFLGVCCYPSHLIPPQHVLSAALPGQNLAHDQCCKRLRGTIVWEPELS